MDPIGAAIAQLESATASLRADCTDREATRDRMEVRLQKALHDLLGPISNPNPDDFPLLLFPPNDAMDEDGDEDELDIGADNNDEEMTDADEISSELGVDNAAEYVFVAGGEHVYAWEYLGEEYSDWIRKLHALPPFEPIPARIQATLYDYQATGVNKMVTAAETLLRGLILGDEMGLGKTLMAVVVGTILSERHRGCFNVVVAPKTTLVQWEEEIYNNVDPPPRVKVLDDSRITANELLDEKVDWVLVSYQAVRTRYARIHEYRKAFEELNPRTTQEADASIFFNTHRRYRFQRPSAALHSDVYEALGLPIRCLFVDEAHNLKSEEGITYEACHAIPAKFRFLLTGTIFANRWKDVYALVTFLHGHPFTTRTQFQKAFAKQEGRSTITIPTRSKEARLVKFLQGLFVARPASVLELPEMEEHTPSMFLANTDVVNIITYLVSEFYNAISKGHSSADEVAKGTASGDMWQQRAVFCMNIAQVLANHPKMLKKPQAEYVRDIRDMAVKFADRFVDTFQQHGVGTGEYFYAIMQHLDSGLSKVQRVAPGPKAKRIPPKPDDAVSLSKAHGARVRRSNRRWMDPNESPAETPSDSEQASDDDGYEDDDNDSIWEPGGDALDLDYVPEEEEEQVEEDLETQDLDDANREFLKTRSETAEHNAWLDTVANMDRDDVLSPRVSKVLELLNHIGRAHNGEKVLVFSRFRKFHDLVARACQLEDPGGLEVYRYDGKVRHINRKTTTDEFSAYAGPKQAVMLITAGCGGAGLNLASASHVILCEPWWRESDVRQAIGRAFRRKQKLTVHVWRVTALDSVVDLVMQRISGRKAQVNDALMKQLCRPDGEEPVIPAQYVGGGSGEYH